MVAIFEVNGDRASEIRFLVDSYREFWAMASEEEREYAERVIAERDLEDLVMNMPEAELLDWEDN